MFHELLDDYLRIVYILNSWEHSLLVFGYSKVVNVYVIIESLDQTKLIQQV
jgi:hypothetical protein